jgi:hypothetical protein
LVAVAFFVAFLAGAFFAAVFVAAGTAASWFESPTRCRPSLFPDGVRRPSVAPSKMILATLRREVNEIRKVALRVAIANAKHLR